MWIIGKKLCKGSVGESLESPDFKGCQKKCMKRNSSFQRGPLGGKSYFLGSPKEGEI